MLYVQKTKNVRFKAFSLIRRYPNLQYCGEKFLTFGIFFQSTLLGPDSSSFHLAKRVFSYSKLILSAPLPPAP